MQSNYQAAVVNVNNFYQKKNCYLALAIALAQEMPQPIAIYDAEENLIYCNNRLGSLNNSRKRDLKNLTTVAGYLNDIYLDIETLYCTVRQVYKDLHQRNCIATLRTGITINFKIIPVIENFNLVGVVVIGC